MIYCGLGLCICVVVFIDSCCGASVVCYCYVGIVVILSYGFEK